MENYTPAAEIAVATEKLWNWIDQVIPAQNPIIPIGFSQGALMATQLLRTRPQRISKAILMAGFINPIDLETDADCRKLKPKVLYCRGELDNRISEDSVTKITDWLHANTSLQLKTYSGLGHSVDQRVINDVSNFLLSKN
jgi:phospholipase/carboxylesterase